MLGFHENFPETIHGTARFVTSVSNKKLQQALAEALLTLNNETFSPEAVGDPLVPSCAVNFEFGIAEGADFNYVDREEVDKILKTIHRSPFQIMDFLCIVRYYRTREGRKTPLRFDYYMLRCMFSEDPVEMQVFHEKGPRYISPEDIFNLVAKKINEKSQKRILKALNEDS
jgi:hypothetical protein